MSSLPAKILNAKTQHTATVIFLHGLGDSGHGWAPVAEMLQPHMKHVKFILPHAPNKPVSLNSGMLMPSWYDIYSLTDRDGRQDEEGLLDSVKEVRNFVTKEIDSGIPSERIVVSGFSQGCAVALLYAALAPFKHAGFMGLSGYIPLEKKLIATEGNFLKKLNFQTPVQLYHGEADQVVQLQWGRNSYELLKKLGFEKVNFTTYKDMAHSSSDEEIRDVANFLKKVLPE
ncbi:hypothetical protein HK099_006558 [Clydaea vesicula]|uniref:Acyl-protein thioesterase 1 n=1 Tax=Clydaea vesicula TaxID=447962 RepID=A0AAD5XU74_9FUNG|nr:hypothetical protein HK099_006558 [Clydaea vesicula]